MKKKYSAAARIWIDGEGGIFLGEGRVSLLEEIDQCGSINLAAKKMNMSYKKALKLLETMNIEAEKPLVISTSGGKGGGGSQVTREGKKAIVLYRTLSASCRTFLNSEFERLMKT